LRPLDRIVIEIDPTEAGERSRQRRLGQGNLHDANDLLGRDPEHSLGDEEKVCQF
jgi:hypothetical protein